MIFPFISIEVYAILLLLAIPVFFFWRFVLKKFVSMTRIRKILTWLLTLMTTPLLYMGLVFLLITAVTYYPRYDFDQEKRRADPEQRYEMSQDMIESKMLLAKTKEEVKELLGEPDSADGALRTYYVWFSPRLFAVDPDHLAIEFDAEGRVVDVRQYNS